MLKKLIFFINLFFFSNITMFLTAEIIPLKKPIQTKEEKDQKLLSDVLKPLPKPSIKKVVEEIEKKPEKEIKLKAEKNLGIILPKKKPLIAGTTKTETTKKSKYYSKKDFEIAKKAISEMKQAKWPTALKTAKRAKDKSIYNFIQWRHLLTKGNKASYYDYKTFIDSNEDYPRLGRIKYLAEHKLSTVTISPKKIIDWFGADEPLSGFGKMILGESIILNGNTQKGISYIKEGWITAELSKSELRFYRKKFKKYLNADDYIKRADYLAWNNKYWDLKRLLRYLPKDYELLYTARQLLMSKSYGVDNAISKVPTKFKNDAGLNYDRLKWRRKRGRVDSSVEILVKIKNTKDYLVRPDKWWFEREIISRSLIYKKKYELAYKIASNHALTDGPEYAAAEWMSGWIALSFLDDPLLAKDHFENFYNNVGYPISTSRGAYWLAKTYQKLGKKELANEWFGKASNFLTTYYGQLAFIELNPNQPFELSKDISGDGKIDINDLEWRYLDGDGDFRSSEIEKLRDESDIIITNPPFSLFREYISQLEEYNKKFLIIGNTNSITYKETFALIKDNKLRTGYTNFNVGMFFIVPDDWEKYHHIDESGKKISEIDAVASTAGPGLIVCLSVGLSFGKAFASAINKPFIAINHLEGHALSPKLNSSLKY